MPEKIDPVIAVWVRGRRQSTERYVLDDERCPACSYVDMTLTDLAPGEHVLVQFEQGGQVHDRRVECDARGDLVAVAPAQTAAPASRGDVGTICHELSQGVISGDFEEWGFTVTRLGSCVHVRCSGRRYHGSALTFDAAVRALALVLKDAS